MLNQIQKNLAPCLEYLMYSSGYKDLLLGKVHGTQLNCTQNAQDDDNYNLVARLLC